MLFEEGPPLPPPYAHSCTAPGRLLACTHFFSRWAPSPSRLSGGREKAWPSSSDSSSYPWLVAQLTKRRR
eukprot:scaffold9772_cov128-Isochrysis_galbana.AAC.5